jgi:hypothetical protein
MFCLYCGNALAAVQPQVPVQAVPQVQPVPQPMTQPAPAQQVQPVPQPVQAQPQQAYQQPVQQVAQPAATMPSHSSAEKALVNPPSFDSAGSRLLMLLMLIAAAASPFLDFYSAGKKKFSFMDLSKAIFDTKKFLDTFQYKSDGLGIAVGFVFVGALFYFLGYVAIIAGVYDLAAGSAKKIEKFWTNVLCGSLGIFMANVMCVWVIAYMNTDKGSKLKVFHFEPVSYVMLALSFFVFVIAKILSGKWRRYNAAAQTQA